MEAFLARRAEECKRVRYYGESEESRRTGQTALQAIQGGRYSVEDVLFVRSLGDYYSAMRDGREFSAVNLD